jgi:hypothetical protein
MQFSENVYSDNFKLDVKKMAEESYQGPRKGIALTMDRQFDQVIHNTMRKHYESLLSAHATES